MHAPVQLTCFNARILGVFPSTDSGDQLVMVMSNNTCSKIVR